jgi:signal transduction histidine kinase
MANNLRNKLVSVFRISEAGKYAIGGTYFGMCFPVFSTFFDLMAKDLEINWINILYIQINQPLHWVIDSAPLFLGLFAYWIGVRQGKHKISKDFYERILNSIPIDIAVFDNLHRYKFVNTQAVSNPELRKSIIGKDDFEYFEELGRTSEIPKLRRERFNQVVSTHSIVEWKQKHSNEKALNSTTLRRLSPVLDKTGEIDLVIGYGMDITKQVELGHKIESLSRFPNENPNPVMRLSIEGVILFANDSAMENFLLPHNLKLGDTISEDYSYLMNLPGAKIDRVERILKFNNKTFSVLYVKVPDKEYMNVYASDITNSTTEIEKRERKLKSEIAHSNELIKNLGIVNKFSMLIQESQTIEDVAWSICENAIKHLGYEDCIIYLLDEKKPGYLYQAAALGNKNPKERIILGPLGIKIGEGIVGHVASTGISQLIPDTSKDKRYVTDDVRRLSEITVPIINNSKVIGVIDSEHTQKNFFPNNHLDLLNTISAMTATKIVQVKYNEEIIAHKTDLEQTVEKRTSELIEVEKLAVLGRLSAGVAHEMNTPLGAIYASSENLDQLLKSLFEKELQDADYDTIHLACTLAEKLDTAEKLISSREERIEVNKLIVFIEGSEKIRDAASKYVRELVACGITLDNSNELEQLFKKSNYDVQIHLLLSILRIRKSLGTISFASKKAATVVKALKSYVHEGDNEVDAFFNLKDSIVNTLILFKGQTKQNIEVHFDDARDWMVLGNESEASKIWSNLIANSIYAIGNKKGNIWIEIKEIKSQLSISFSNDGPIIPKEVRLKMFDPFYTTKPIGEGSGMGLSMVRNVLSDIGGTIDLLPGDKTTFIIEIPNKFAPI